MGRRTVLVGAGAAGAAGAAALVGSVGGPAGTGRAAQVGAGAVAVGAAAQAVKVTIEVNKAALVGQLHAYLLDPHFSVNRHPVVEDWSKRLDLPPALLEALRLDGEPSREDLEQFVDGLLSGYENLVVR